jgi:predicted O-methyltransferase YrrM
MIERFRSLTRPQAAALAVAGTAVLASWVAAATGRPGLAVSFVAFLLLCVVLGIVHLSRWANGIYRANRAANRELCAIVEQTQRRVVAAVEKERVAAGDRHDALTKDLAHGFRQQGHGTDLLLRAQSREIEALHQLFGEFRPRAPMPSSGDFALNPTDLLELLHLVRLRRPGLVVELGSGTSTIWLAYAQEQHGGRLVSLDHDADYGLRTHDQLGMHGLSGTAEVRVAPLADLEADGRMFRWYDPEKLADLHDIELLVIDGPPAATGPDARYPAMHALATRLAPEATIVLDDVHRADEREAVRRWTENVAGLAVRTSLLGRHAVLTYTRDGARV